jgi:hypothetical protein
VDETLAPEEGPAPISDVRDCCAHPALSARASMEKETDKIRMMTSELKLKRCPAILAAEISAGC